MFRHSPPDPLELPDWRKDQVTQLFPDPPHNDPLQVLTLHLIAGYARFS